MFRHPRLVLLSERLAELAPPLADEVDRQLYREAMSVVEGEGIGAADLLPVGEQLAQFPEPPIERQAEPLLFQPS